MDTKTVNVHEWLNYQNTLSLAVKELVEAERMAWNMGLTDQATALQEALLTCFHVQAKADEPL